MIRLKNKKVSVTIIAIAVIISQVLSMGTFTFANSGTLVYSDNFDNVAAPYHWSIASGTGIIGYEGHVVGGNDFDLNVRANNDQCVVVDSASPEIADGEYVFNVSTFNSEQTRFGGVFRYTSPDLWAAIVHDYDGKWYWVNGKNQYAVFATPTIEPLWQHDRPITVSIKYKESKVTLNVYQDMDGDGVAENILSETGNCPLLPKAAGKIGVRTWYLNTAVCFDDISLFN